MTELLEEAKGAEPVSPPAVPGFLTMDTTDILRVYQMAKVGLHKAQWRPSRTMVSAYRKVKAALQSAGALPQ